MLVHAISEPTWSDERYLPRKTMKLHTALISCMQHCSLPPVSCCVQNCAGQSAVRQPGTEILQLAGLLHVAVGSQPSCVCLPAGRHTRRQYFSERNAAPSCNHCRSEKGITTRVGTLIEATICLPLIQNRYMFRSFTVLQCSHQHCVQPVASDVEVVGYL